MHRHYLSTVGKLSNKLFIERIYKISEFIAEFSQNTVSAVLNTCKDTLCRSTLKVLIFLIHVPLTQIFESFDLKLVKMDPKFHSLYFHNVFKNNIIIRVTFFVS